jgi:hypothetical protein
VAQNITRSVLVIDPSCQAIHGHHFNSLRDLSAALAPSSLSFIVHSAMPPGADFGPNVSVIRAFKSTVYDEPGLGPRPNDRLGRRVWKLKRVFNAAVAGTDRAWANATASFSPDRTTRAQNWEFATWSRKWPELRTALTNAVTGPVAHIVAPSSDVELICGLAQLRDELPHLRNAHIHARLISLAPTLSRLRTDPTATPAFSKLMADRLSNVHLYVETPAMQSLLAQASGLASTIYPYLLSPPPFVPRTETDPVRFGYFGGMRNEKGFKRLLPIIKLAAQFQLPSDPSLAFTIHGGDAKGTEAADLKNSFAAITTPRLTIDFIAGPLNETDYLDNFSAIDGALLPYTGARYASSGSGIVCEALAMGKVILLSKGLSFGGQCDPSHSIEAADDTEFAEAILKVARNLRSYRIAAHERAARYILDAKSCALLQRLTTE